LRCRKKFAAVGWETKLIAVKQKWLWANKAANSLQTPHEHNEEGA